MSQRIKESTLAICYMILRNIAKIFWAFPVRNNRIACISYAGKQFSCNPLYISEYLIEKYPNNFEIVAAVRKPESVQDNQIKPIKVLSLKQFFYFCTAKVIISNGGMPSYIPKRKSQFVINTWHGGGAYKKNTVGVGARKWQNIYKSSCTDIVISSCQAFSDSVIPDIMPEYNGYIMKCGMPRNDIMFSVQAMDIREKVCSQYNLPISAMLVLIAPTFRGEYSLGDGGKLISPLDINAIKISLQKKYGKECAIIYRGHNSISSSNFSSHCIDATSYPDMQELLCAADILISDYSSTIWDFSLTKKPCFLYCPDLDYYLNEDRGVYTLIETWPGILCRSNEELEQAILNFDESEYVKKVEKHHADLGSYETGHACEQVCKRIAEVCGIEEES